MILTPILDLEIHNLHKTHCLNDATDSSAAPVGLIDKTWIMQDTHNVKQTIEVKISTICLTISYNSKNNKTSIVIIANE